MSLVNGAWWCDANAKVRVAVWDNRLIDPALSGLRVAYTDPKHEVDRVTADRLRSKNITKIASGPQPWWIRWSYHEVSSGRLPDQMIRYCENEKYAQSMTKASIRFARS